MFDKDRVDTMPPVLAPPPPVPVPVPEPTPLEEMGLEELLTLRSGIDTLLPPTKLADIDLESEVGLQYQRTKALMTDVVSDKDVPANQRAQVANSCASVLQSLVKMQSQLFDAERVKALEAALIKTLKTLPIEQQTQFFELYETNYAAANDGRQR